MFVLLLAPILSVTVQALNFQPAGRAISIMSLALSIPHSFFLRDHSRSLDFLQTSYLVLNCSGQTYQSNLDYSVVTFLPTFISQGQVYFEKAGGYLSFLLIVMGVIAITYAIFRIERMFTRKSMTFTEPWLVLRAFIDWIYLILFRVTCKSFIEMVVKGSEIASSVAEFTVMCLVFVGYVIYHILLMSVDVGMSEKPTPEELHTNKRNKLTEMITYCKGILLSLLLAFSEVFRVQAILYGFLGVIVVYFAMYMVWYDFVGVSEKVLFALSQCAMACNIALIINNQNVDIVYIAIIAIYVGESLMDVYKFYRAMMYRRKKQSTIHPEPCKQILEIPEASLPQQKQLDVTEVQLEVPVPQKKSWRKRSRNLFDSIAGRY